MFCSNCGKPMGEKDRFCSECGAINTEATSPEAPAMPPEVAQVPVTPPEAPVLSFEAPVPPEAPTPPAPPIPPTPPVSPPPITPPSGPALAGKVGLDDKTLSVILRIVAGLFGAWFLWTTIQNILSFFRFLPNMGYWLPWSLFSLILILVSILSSGVICAAMIATAALWKPELSDKLFLGACLGVVVHAVNIVLGFFVTIINAGFGYAIGSIPGRIGGLLIVALPAAAFYLVTYLMGTPVLKGKNLKDFIPESVSKVGEQSTPRASGQAAPAPEYRMGSKKTNRSLLMYILLNIITCGIYSYIFIYSMGNDMNDIGAGDGEKTGGLAAYILLSIVTCGIYALIWNYKLCNRMAATAPRYGLVFQENGTTYLLWVLVGMLLCGLGPLIALNFMIRNMNTLCVAYNQRNGLYGG